MILENGFCASTFSVSAIILVFFKIFVKDFLFIDGNVNSLCDTCFKRNESFCLFLDILGDFVTK